MSEIQIKQESQPQRCEVCHQADCFNPEINYCARCANTTISSYVSAGGFIPNDKTTVDVKLDLPNFIQAMQELVLSNSITKFGNKLRFPMGLFFGILYLIIFIKLTSLDGMGYALYHTPPILLIDSALFLIVFNPKFLNRFLFNRLKDFQKNFLFTFSNSEFEIINEKKNSQINWKNLLRVTETDHSFIFTISRREYYIIPKKFFNHPEQIKVLKEILNNHYPDIGYRFGLFKRRRDRN